MELNVWQLKGSGEVARRVGRGTWRYIQSRSFSNGILRNSLKELPVRRFFLSDGELPEKKNKGDNYLYFERNSCVFCHF